MAALGGGAAYGQAYYSYSDEPSLVSPSDVKPLGEKVTVEDMRQRFRECQGQEIAVPSVTQDLVNGSCMLYPAPLRTDGGQGVGRKCFWSTRQTHRLLKEENGRKYYTPKGCPEYFRLDSIEGLRREEWPEGISEKCSFRDEALDEVYAKGLSGTFYSCEPQYCMGWWVSNFFSVLEVDGGRVKTSHCIRNGKARDVAFDKGFSPAMGRVGIGNYLPEFTIALGSYVNGVDGVRKDSRNPKVYDFLVSENGEGYDIEVLNCSSETGPEFEALREKVRQLPADYFTPLYTLGGVRLPGFYLEGSYEPADDGRNWRFGCRKYFAEGGKFKLE